MVGNSEQGYSIQYLVISRGRENMVQWLNYRRFVANTIIALFEPGSLPSIEHKSGSNNFPKISRFSSDNISSGCPATALRPRYLFDFLIHKGRYSRTVFYYMYLRSFKGLFLSLLNKA